MYYYYHISLCSTRLISACVSQFDKAPATRSNHVLSVVVKRSDSALKAVITTLYAL